MSDRGSTGDGWDEQPTEHIPPPRRDEPAEGSDLPPIGADRDPEPTRVVPTPPSAAEPTVAMPSTGEPIGPGGPYVPPGGGGPGGPGDEPPFDEEPEQPWYRQPGPVAALIAGVAALVLGLIALLVIRSNDDNDGDNTLPTVVSTTTTPSTVPATSSSTTSTTAPGTTTSSSSTTSTTSTSTTTTTTPPTTTTTSPPTTTTTPPTTTTTSPATTTTVPVPTAWDVIQDNPDLSEFADAIQAFNLVDLVDGPQAVTVLAPEDDPGAPPPPYTGELVRRQIIGQALTEAQLFQQTSVQTLSGATLAVDAGAQTVGDVSIVDADLDAANGFIQVVSGLVQPS